MSASSYPIALVTFAASALADIYNDDIPSGFFLGKQNGIGSWFRASAGAGSTNDKS
jgi:hypothetical protein